MSRSRFAVLAGTAVLLCATARADEATVPLQKPGLWQQTMSRDGKPDPNEAGQVCLDSATEQKLISLNQQIAAKNCQSRHVARVAAGWTIDTVCVLSKDWKTQSHSLITGNFDGKVTTDISTTTSGAPVPSLDGVHRLVLSATWLGPCKPGQKGGDVVMANGNKMNLLDAANAVQRMPPLSKH